jgi:ribosome-associated protein
MADPNADNDEQWSSPPESVEPEFKSKTQLKRDAEAKQQLATRLVNLSDANLAKIPMDEELAEAITTARKINRKKDGFRRQLQFLGKMMRSIDTQDIENAINALGNQHLQANAHFHYLERARDSIVSKGNEAIESLLQQHPELERQKLRQLQRNAAKEAKQNKPPAAAREIFKYLKESIQEQ